MKKLKIGQAVIIEWYDHCSYHANTWTNKALIRDNKPILITTLGFLINENKETYIVASTIDGEDNMMKGDLCIIKATVKSIKSLPTLFKFR